MDVKVQSWNQRSQKLELIACDPLRRVFVPSCAQLSGAQDTCGPFDTQTHERRSNCNSGADTISILFKMRCLACAGIGLVLWSWLPQDWVHARMLSARATEDLHSLVDCLSHVMRHSCQYPACLPKCHDRLQPSTGPKRHQQVPFALIHRHTDCAGF